MQQYFVASLSSFFKQGADFFFFSSFFFKQSISKDTRRLSNFKMDTIVVGGEMKSQIMIVYIDSIE